MKVLSKESLFVKWQEPVNDGGSPVTGYHVECRQRDVPGWKRLNRIPVKSTQFKASGLREGAEYEIRVIAENLAGCGKASRLCDGIFTRDPVDAPLNVCVSDLRFAGSIAHRVILVW